MSITRIPDASVLSFFLSACSARPGTHCTETLLVRVGRAYIFFYASQYPQASTCAVNDCGNLEGRTTCRGITPLPPLPYARAYTSSGDDKLYIICYYILITSSSRVTTKVHLPKAPISLPPRRTSLDSSPAPIFGTPLPWTRTRSTPVVAHTLADLICVDILVQQ